MYSSEEISTYLYKDLYKLVAGLSPAHTQLVAAHTRRRRSGRPPRRQASPPRHTRHSERSAHRVLRPTRNVCRHHISHPHNCPLQQQSKWWYYIEI